MSDKEIIQLFFARDQQALRALDEKYGKACRALSRSIVGNGQDAEECVNDAYLGAWNAIPPARPDPLLAYLCKIVRNLSIARYHLNTAAKRSSAYTVALAELEGCLASPHTVEEALEEKALTAAIEAFLATLSQENRVIFLRRYWFADNYKEIAACVGISEKNVSVRLARMRRQLRTYLTERGFLP